MGKGKGKRKMDDTRVGEQPKDQELGLVIDTNYHTSSLYARTFRQILYEDYKIDKAPEHREERETWLKVKRSGLPLIAARPTLLPFHDMTRWILSRCHAKGVVLKAYGSNLISFAPDNVSAIYRLPKLEDIADEAYMKAFAGRHPDYDDCIQEWWFDDDAFKPSPLRVYQVQNFHEDYRLVAIMLCRLMGEKNCNIFKKEWVPYMYAVVEQGRVLNWANILADVMQKVLRKYLEVSEVAKPQFYMFSYLLDMVLAMIEFPELKLKW